MSAHILRHLRRRFADASPDAALLHRYLDRRDEDAFRALVERHGPTVLSVCRRRLGDAHAADDAFQATFLVLARNARSVRQPAGLSAWLYGVARRVCAKSRVARERRRDVESQVPPSAPAADPADALLARELLDVLDAELDRLPKRYRTPLWLVYWQGQSHADASRELGLAAGALHGRLERGRRRLADRLRRRGIGTDGTERALLLAATGSVAVSGELLARTVALASTPWSSELPAAVLMLVTTSGPSKFLPAATLAMLIASAGAIGWLASRGRERPEAAPPVAQAPGTPRIDAQQRTDRFGDPLPPGAIARLGTIRLRTGGNGIRGLGFLADNKTLAAVTEGRSVIQIWDSGTGKQLREIGIGKLTVGGFALSPDRRYAAVSGFVPRGENRPTSGAIVVWDMASGRQMQSFERTDRDLGHCVMAFIPGGKLLASLCSNSALLRIEEIASGEELLRHRFPHDVVGSLAVSPDGTTIAVHSGPNSRKMFVWKWQAAEEPRELTIPGYGGRSVSFSSDGTKLAECGQSEQGIRVWDVASGKLVHNLKPPGTDFHRPNMVTYSPDGKLLIASTYVSTSMTVHVWDAATGEYRNRFDPGGGLLAVSPDSRLLAGSGHNGMVRVWDLDRSTELLASDEAHQSNVDGIAVGRDLVATAGDDHSIRIWDVATGRQRRKLMHERWVRAIALSPDGTLLVSSSLDDTVCLWEVATGRKVYTLPGHGKSGGHRVVAFAADGRSCMSWGDDLYLRKWDVGTGKLILECEVHPGRLKSPDDRGKGRAAELTFRVVGRAFTPDGATLVMSAGDQFHLFEVASGKELRQIPNGGISVMSLAISPDSRLLLASSWGKPIQSKFPDGRVRFSAPKSHTVSLWELASGELRKQLEMPEDGTGPVAFSANSTMFATATSKPTSCIQLWDVRTRQEVGSIRDIRGVVRSMTFSPDGKLLITGMDDTTALVWDVPVKR